MLLDAMRPSAFIIVNSECHVQCSASQPKPFITILRLSPELAVTLTVRNVMVLDGPAVLIGIRFMCCVTTEMFCVYSTPYSNAYQ